MFFNEILILFLRGRTDLNSCELLCHAVGRFPDIDYYSSTALPLVPQEQVHSLIGLDLRAW